jgi:L-lactate dehydrogenase complex protein LldE
MVQSADKPSRIQLFVTCLVDHLAPDVAEAVVSVLERVGVAVTVPAGQTCCGQPASNAGFVDEAKTMARHTIKVLERDAAPIVLPSGSCADMIVHHYPELFADEPAWRVRAEAIAGRTYEFTQFLVDGLGVTELGARCQGRLTYHSSCHLQRNLAVRRQPEALLAQVAEAELVPLPNADECCGFGGLFSLKFPGISEDMLANKLRHLASTEADCLVGCDLSCLLHINGGLHRQGQAPIGRHIAEILAGRA